MLPDIVTMAKGIGNGAPLAAVVTTPEVAAVMTQRIHLNTFGGNPVSCAAGRAVLKVRPSTPSTSSMHATEVVRGIQRHTSLLCGG